jgi:cobalt-zinc-cadmium resistance protein CzcA
MIDRIIEISLRNRFGVTMGAFLLVSAGSVALWQLPIDAMPDVTSEQVQILTKAPARGPLEIEQFITRPVENAMSGIPHLEQIRSMAHRRVRRGGNQRLQGSHVTRSLSGSLRVSD